MIFIATAHTVNVKPDECPTWLSGIFLLIIFLISIAVGILMIVSMWLIFKKAGKPGWASIIPIYNIIVMLKITHKPTWWIILYFIPIINIIIFIAVIYNMALAFGKGGRFTVGLILLPFIFYPILAFGRATYMQATQTAVSAGIPPSATP